MCSTPYIAKNIPFVEEQIVARDVSLSFLGAHTHNKVDVQFAGKTFSKRKKIV